MKVPDNLEAGYFKRELALKGYHVVKCDFASNTVTGERTGDGFIQIRSANPRYQEEFKREIEDFGVKLGKKKVEKLKPHQTTSTKNLRK